MAKTKTKSHSRSKSSSIKPDSILHSTDAHINSAASKSSGRSIEDLLTEAATLLEQSQPDLALPLAEEALRRLQAERDASSDPTFDQLLVLSAREKPTLPTALTITAETHLALGDALSARNCFQQAVQIDPDGALISADPWLWLAQLCEEGGSESIQCFERGCDVLRTEIDALEDSKPDSDDDEATQILEERRAKLADALCGMAEVYMTDLSWEADAEQRCEAYVTEAVAVCPERLSAGCLQTLASVRISQERVDEARNALKQSLQMWKDIPAELEDEAKPEYATRISLARLLMEVEAETEAMIVLEGLVKEDDQSVECWYLGAWCQLLLSEKNSMDDVKRQVQEQARLWLDNCLRLFKAQEYEDDRLKEHALELKQQLDQILGIEDEDDAWQDEDEEDVDGEDIVVQVNGHDADDDDVEMT